MSTLDSFVKAAFPARPFNKSVDRVFILTFLLFFLTTSPANSNLTIKPVSLEFSPKVTVQEITLENQSSETKAFEVRLKKWEQDKSKDIYFDTNDVIVFPLTTKIPPRSKQRFRLILKSLPEGSKQVAYRLFFDERAYQTRSKPENSAITFMLNMTVPVFVVGSKFKAVENVNWSANLIKKDNSIVLSLTNNGSTFLKLKNITAKEVSSFQSGDWQYVLPATTRSWTMPLTKMIMPNSLTLSYSSVESLDETRKSVSVPLLSGISAGKTSDSKAPNAKVASKKP